MIKTMDPEMVKAITNAVYRAVEVVGIDGLRGTSMFPSSQKKLAELPLAA